MASELRALMSDIDADEITRPDIPAALATGDDAPSSGFHQRVERELVPYTSVPVLTARFNEATVPDAALRVSMAAARAREHHTPSDASVPPPSGTREQLASTVPPPAVTPPVPVPGHERAKEPATIDVGSTAELPWQTAETWRRKADPSRRIATPLPSLVPSFVPLPLPAARPEHRLRAYVLVAVTAVTAALVGVGLGNGSLARFGGRLHMAFVGPDEAPAPLAATPVAQVRAPSSLPTAATAPTRAAPRAVAAEEAPKVPVLRLEQLPPTQHDAKPAELKPSETKRVRRAPRR
jgi:hypothetical protein